MEQNLANYRLVISIIIIIIIFIISIIIISTFATINTKSKKVILLIDSRQLFSRNYSAISAIFSLEIILIFIFFILIIVEKTIKENLEIVILIISLLCQFLYLINCVIIPIFLKEFRYIIKSNENEEHSFLKELNNIKSYYKGAIWICYIFLVFILFLDFILLNLFKKLFFNAEAFITFLLETFCHGFYEKDDIKNKEKENKEKKIERKKLTEEIKKLLAEEMNIKINEYKNKIKEKIKTK